MPDYGAAGDSDLDAVRVAWRPFAGMLGTPPHLRDQVRGLLDGDDVSLRRE
jgi:hypothetical protein